MPTTKSKYSDCEIPQTKMAVATGLAKDSNRISDDLTINLKSVLTSFKDGLTANRIEAEYMRFIGQPFPYQTLGYRRISEFLNAHPNICEPTKLQSGTVIYKPKITEDCQHIWRLVNCQKYKSPTRMSRPCKRKSISIDEGEVVPPKRSKSESDPSGPRQRHKPSKIPKRKSLPNQQNSALTLPQDQAQPQNQPSQNQPQSLDQPEEQPQAQPEAEMLTEKPAELQLNLAVGVSNTLHMLRHKNFSPPPSSVTQPQIKAMLATSTDRQHFPRSRSRLPFYHQHPGKATYNGFDAAQKPRRHSHKDQTYVKAATTPTHFNKQGKFGKQKFASASKVISSSSQKRKHPRLSNPQMVTSTPRRSTSSPADIPMPADIRTNILNILMEQQKGVLVDELPQIYKTKYESDLPVFLSTTAALSEFLKCLQDDVRVVSNEDGSELAKSRKYDQNVSRAVDFCLTGPMKVPQSDENNNPSSQRGPSGASSTSCDTFDPASATTKSGKAAPAAVPDGITRTYSLEKFAASVARNAAAKKAAEEAAIAKAAAEAAAAEAAAAEAAIVKADAAVAKAFVAKVAVEAPEIAEAPVVEAAVVEVAEAAVNEATAAEKNTASSKDTAPISKSAPVALAAKSNEAAISGKFVSKEACLEELVRLLANRPRGMFLGRLKVLFKKKMGFLFPFEKFGYDSERAFFLSMPAKFDIRPVTNQICIDSDCIITAVMAK